MDWNFFTYVPDIENNLFPNLTTLVSHILACSIILFFVVRWVWKPFKKSQKERSEYIRKNIRDAENSKLIAIHHEEITQKYLEEAKLHATNIVGDARIKAQVVADKIISDTNAKSELATKENFESIEKEKAKSAAETKKQIVNIAILAAQKIVEKNIDENTNKKMISEFIDDLEK